MDKRQELYDYYKSEFDSIEINDDADIIKYTSVENEYNILKTGVGVRDLSNYSKIFIHGKDSQSLLRRLTTNKIIDLNVLEWIKTLFVNSDGNIIDKTLLMKFEDYFILIGANKAKSKLYKWIKRFIIDDDIVISNSDDDYSVFEVMGQQATSYMSMILGDKFNELNEKNILRVQIDDFFVHGVRINDGAKVDKYIVIVDSIHAIKTLKIMHDLKSVFDFGMIGEEAFNVYRIQNGIPIAPNELNDSVNPKEVYLDSEISKHKEDFIGHDNVEESDNDIARLVKIEFEREFDSNELPISIYDNDNHEVGVVTSYTNSKLIKKQIGLGFVIASYHLNGNKYYISEQENKIEVKICELSK